MRRRSLAVAALISGAILAAALVAAPAAAPAKPAAAPPGPPAPPPIGYDDTPMLPDGKWRVHDGNRPRPRMVTPPSAVPPADPGRPPSDALVLFDGKDLSHWQTQGKGPDKGKLVPAAWKVENGYMEAVPGAGSLISKESFGDCQLHVEWASPAEVKGASQGRGNGGVLLMGRYEVQVLDSWDNITYADGQAAALYGQYPPLVNASRRPGQWQAFDIIFEAPRFEDGKLARPAFVTVLHNGLVMHHRQQLIGTTGHKQVGKYTPHEPELPLTLQEHGNPTRFRNIWVRRLTGYDEPAPPPAAK
ncbi:MAG: DUF1080 domain-containing protein [Planctomycetes bacterium]|nr:DUF1080 domain-containing protein [Planctomycetota bacterium]